METENKEKELVLILDDIRSAYNVGSIFRTAEGAGVSKIYLTGYTPSPALSGKIFLSDSEKMIKKTALGAENIIKWEKVSDIKIILENLKAKNFKIIALEKEPKSLDIKNFLPSFPMAIILGNEVEGVKKDIIKLCNQVLSIKMSGKKESLNVSVAAGIAVYEILFK